MIVVADTSVMLNLVFVGQVELLAVLFREVLVPRAVVSEFARLSASDGRFAAVAPVVDALLERAHFRAAPDLVREVLRLAGEA